VYCLPSVQAPSWQGDFCSHANASVTSVSASSTRNGVQNRRSPIAPCRPQGPPIAPLATRTTGSSRDGRNGRRPSAAGSSGPRTVGAVRAAGGGRVTA
jgi:hypothetical protein